MLLAARMSTTRIIGLDARASVAAELQREINKQDLMSIQAKDSVLLRYPHDQFMQRVHTYVPGSEAYPEVLISPFFIIFICILFDLWMLALTFRLLRQWRR